jgi:hypothetical protein
MNEGKDTKLDNLRQAAKKFFEQQKSENIASFFQAKKECEQAGVLACEVQRVIEEEMQP